MSPGRCTVGMKERVCGGINITRECGAGYGQTREGTPSHGPAWPGARPGPQGSGWQVAAAVAREAWPHGDLNKGQAPSDSETNAERHRPMIYMTVIGYKNLLSGYKQESGAVGERARSFPRDPGYSTLPRRSAPRGTEPPGPAAAAHRRSAALAAAGPALGSADGQSPSALFFRGPTLGRVCFGELPPEKRLCRAARRRPGGVVGGAAPARLAPARTYPGC